MSLARPPGDLESLFHSPYCFCEGKLFSEVNLWHLTYPPLWLLAHKAFAESFHFSRLAAMVLASLRPMIPILHYFFLFQPCASSWTLVFLFFCFLLVPKSLLCCSRCFWSCISICPIMSHLLIYAVSPFYSEVSYPLFLVALQYWHALVTGFVGLFVDICHETHLLLCRPFVHFLRFTPVQDWHWQCLYSLSSVLLSVLRAPPFLGGAP